MSADGSKNAPVETRAPAGPPSAPPEPVARRNYRRYALMAVVPIVLLGIGGYWWLTGGRYVATDDAYVQQDTVTINSQVSGRIISAPHRPNDLVAAGDVLFVIDQQPYKIALSAAESGLASARLAVEQLRSAYQQAIASQQAASDDVVFQQKEFDRQQGLLGKGVSSQDAYDTAENNLHTAQQNLVKAQESVASALVALGGDAKIPTDQHPMVLAAMAKRDQAALDLQNTTVTAPAAGVIAQAVRLLVGQQVSPSLAVLSLVEAQGSWIEGNFKETDVGKMVPGMPATVDVDAYPGKPLTGVVSSIGAGTGSVFSLLPPQNATGNWVKVVQRVPVEVRLTTPLDGIVLRSGMSATINVDTKSPGGLLAPIAPATPAAPATAAPAAVPAPVASVTPAAPSAPISSASATAAVATH